MRKVAQYVQDVINGYEPEYGYRYSLEQALDIVHYLINQGVTDVTKLDELDWTLHLSGWWEQPHVSPHGYGGNQ